jgi:hypothetical protein
MLMIPTGSANAYRDDLTSAWPAAASRARSQRKGIGRVTAVDETESGDVVRAFSERNRRACPAPLRVVRVNVVPMCGLAAGSSPSPDARI